MLTRLLDKVKKHRDDLKWFIIIISLLVSSGLAVNYLRAFLNDKYNQPSPASDGILYAD